MKQSQYLKIFRMTWLSIAINMILIFINYNFNNVIMLVVSFCVGCAFAIIRLEDNGFIQDTESYI